MVRTLSPKFFRPSLTQIFSLTKFYRCFAKNIEVSRFCSNFEILSKILGRLCGVECASKPLFGVFQAASIEKLDDYERDKIAYCAGLCAKLPSESWR